MAEPIERIEDLLNPNVVKVVSNQDGIGLTLGWAPVPWPRDSFGQLQTELPEEVPAGIDFRRHIGIYAYRVGELNRFVGWPVAPIEECEKLEQLRFMWQGVSIHVADAVENVPAGIDTEEDLQAAIFSL